MWKPHYVLLKLSFLICKMYKNVTYMYCDGNWGSWFKTNWSTWRIECLKIGADSHTHTHTKIHTYTQVHTLSCMHEYTHRDWLQIWNMASKDGSKEVTVHHWRAEEKSQFIETAYLRSKTSYFLNWSILFRVGTGRRKCSEHQGQHHGEKLCSMLGVHPRLVVSTLAFQHVVIRV